MRENHRFDHASYKAPAAEASALGEYVTVVLPVDGRTLDPDSVTICMSRRQSMCLLAALATALRDSEAPDRSGPDELAMRRGGAK